MTLIQAFRRCAWLVGVLLVVGGFSAPARAQSFQLQSMKGRVELRPGGKGGWLALRGGTRRASAGDHLRTGPNSAVYVITSTGQRLAVGANTQVVLQASGKKGVFRVLLGRLMVFITGKQPLEVRAPSAVAAAEGTIFEVAVDALGVSVLTVVQGQVNFANDLGSVMVADSQQSTAEPGQAPTRPMIVDAANLTAWEAQLETMIIDVEVPPLNNDPEALKQELQQRESTLKANPADPAAMAAVSEALLGLDRTDEAVAMAEQAVAKSPMAAYQGQLGYALLQAGRAAEARQQFELAAAGEPTNARWQIGLGLVALGQRDAAPALAALQRAAELAPEDALPQTYLAAAYLRTGDLTQADLAAAKAAQLGPDHYLAQAYLAHVRLAQNKPAEARTAAARAAQLAPRSALAHGTLGTVAFFAGDFGTARSELDQAIAIDSLSAGAHLTLAKLAAATDDMELAVNEAQVAVALNPQSAPARSALGVLLLANNDPRRAGREFEAALALDPELAEAQTGWGASLAKRGRFQEALAQQKAAVALDGGSAAAHNNLGSVYASDGRMDEAIEQLNKAIALQPRWGVPHANLAVVYLELNRYAEALAEGEKAVSLGERSAFLHTVLARVYVRQGRNERALTSLRQAVALDPNYPQAQYQLSRLYLQQDRARDAVRSTLVATTKDPSAMTETRRYARTDNTLFAGSFDTWHDDVRHSDSAADGRVNYHVGGLAQESDGYREVNQDSEDRFVEVLFGHQDRPTQQFVAWGTWFKNRSGLPGPVTMASVGDPDDRQSFVGRDAVLAWRNRVSPDAAITLKYSYRELRYDFTNPDAFSASDPNPFLSLSDDENQSSPEVRVDLRAGRDTDVRFGYSFLHNDIDRYGTVGSIDPMTGLPVFSGFALSPVSETQTAWLEVERALSDQFALTVGGYWGKEKGSDEILLPKVVALYRPDKSSSLSFIANPIFRADALELAPVEALADPRGLDYLNFMPGGAGRSYELRYQRFAGRGATITAALAHQRVRGLLVFVQDPALTGLPTRALIDRGNRWVADLSYERWLSDRITGQLFGRWQQTEGDFGLVPAFGMDWPYAPQWQAGGRLDYIDDNGWRIGLDGVWVGDRFHDPANTIRVDSYPVFNLQVQRQKSLNWNVFVRLVNLIDEDYVTFAGFPQPGRAIYAGADYRF